MRRLFLVLVAVVALFVVIPRCWAAPTGISEWAVVQEAYSWVGVPYRWGGESRSGVDCSGLVRRVYINASGRRAYYYDRSAAGIRSAARPISSPRPGDVVCFFNKSSGRWDHVGVYLWNGYFVHASGASGKVVVDHLVYSPHYGSGWWARNYVVWFGRYDPDYWVS